MPTPEEIVAAAAAAADVEATAKAAGGKPSVSRVAPPVTASVEHPPATEEALPIAPLPVAEVAPDVPTPSGTAPAATPEESAMPASEEILSTEEVAELLAEALSSQFEAVLASIPAIENIADLVMAQLTGYLDERFAALEVLIRDGQVFKPELSVIPAVASPAKARFDIAVETAFKQVSVDEINKSRNDALMHLELLVNGLKGDYPEVSCDEVRREIKRVVEDEELLLKPYFNDVLDEVLATAYAGSPGKVVGGIMGLLQSGSRGDKTPKVKSAEAPKHTSSTRGKDR